MEKEFILYDLAVKLKELGFDEECLTKWGCTSLRFYENYKPCSNKDDIVLSGDVIAAPLWQQAFDWFRTEHNLHALNSPVLNQEWTVVIDNTLNAHQVYWDKKPNYEEARLECLKKLIEISENNE